MNSWFAIDQEEERRQKCWRTLPLSRHCHRSLGDEEAPLIRLAGSLPYHLPANAISAFVLVCRGVVSSYLRKPRMGSSQLEAKGDPGLWI